MNPPANANPVRRAKGVHTYGGHWCKLLGQRPIRRLRIYQHSTLAFVKRMGKKKALIAVGHSILVILYHMLSKKEHYRDFGARYFDQRSKDSLRNHFVRRLESLGFKVTIEQLQSAA